jgi:hypothetical protein
MSLDSNQVRGHDWLPTTVFAGGLNFPNMITIGGGALWVTANSVCGATDCGVGGTVLRFPLPGEEDNQGQN